MRLPILSALFSVLLMSSSAFADVVLTPYLGYEFGNVSGTQTATYGGTKGESKTTEVSLGARIGYKFSSGLWLAADPQLGLSGKSKSKDSSTSESYKRTQVFADLGYDFSMVGFYFGYALMNEWTFDETKYSGGSAFKLGFNVKLLSNVAFLAEYHMRKYKDISGSGVKVSFDSVYDKFSDSSILVGFAFPFEFGGR